MSTTDLLQSVYHRILPADLRGRLGFGSLLSRWRDRREHQLLGRLACHAPFSSGEVRQRYELTLDAAAHCYDDLLHFIGIQSPGWLENRIIAVTDDGELDAAILASASVLPEATRHKPTPSICCMERHSKTVAKHD
ncbi:hypothetical protein [Cyanobium sp. CH-040]|uniref:hypothetical protein n=1 Tax=Cyanobium sp. CH-040 TaxID=2823708 RepID=UPI0020CC86BF|nr:hypothetical protein [Cyanobium sp. CH-040]MCP9927897.1 hypothetical protein [Cyanobium sp. CH-040]